MQLDDSIQYLKGVGPARAQDLAALGVRTLRDLLWTFPRDLSDRRNLVTIAEAEDGAEAAILARVLEASERKPRGGRLRSVVTALVTDDTAPMEVVWFNSPWVLDQFEGQALLLFGKVKREHGRARMEHPQYELLQGDPLGSALHIGRIVPVYPCTGKLTQKVWRRIMTNAIDVALPLVTDSLPAEFRAAHALPPLTEAVRQMHFPDSPETREAAFRRLCYDECLLLQLAVGQRRRRDWDAHAGRAFAITPALDQRIRRLLPFTLTRAQERCVEEIAADMGKPLPMHRLLQGDVGSGKTVVALYAMLAAVAGGAQVCIMAPTGLLARQHLRTTESFLSRSRHSRVRVALLVGGMNARETTAIRTELAAGAIDILVATHAAVENNVTFKDLGLVVIDEQHKFGVRQRTRLAEKGVRPDVLVMTATPIPRSLALTVYGDLDVSVIDELPPGRKNVRTSAPPKAGQAKAWGFVREQLDKGRQAYIVSPLVEESGELGVTSASEAFETLKAGTLADYHLGLLHGRMKRDEQARIMDEFRAGRIDALVSTVVIEVGVDIPNATVMVVLHAERFGLAQLHQLRGRIGRGAEQGHFIMLSEARTEEARRRLLVLTSSSNGFEIAEEDLKLRGPGQFLGAKQHGMPELKLVDLVRDFDMIKLARIDAEAILRRDPHLSGPDHRVLNAALQRFLAPSPDGPGIG